MTSTSTTSRGPIGPRPLSRLFNLRLTRRGRTNLIAYAFLLPGMAFLLVWLAYPMATALYISLFDWKLMPGAVSDFLGLGNYLKALSDPLFWSAMANTGKYAVVTVAGQLVLGLAVALLLDRVIHGRVLFRALYYLPVITSWVVVSLIFKYLFNSDPSGLINQLVVNLLHVLPKPVSWLNEPNTAFLAMYCLGIWKGVGWTMVIFLAALQSMPEECFAAAAVDGANRGQMLFYLTLPLLLPTIILVLIMLTIGAFQTYIPVALITGGGPMHRTDVILTYLYGQAFNDLKFGYSSALSYIFAVIVFAISQAQLRLTRRDAAPEQF